MTQRPSNPDGNPRPDGSPRPDSRPLGEDQVLDWIEGRLSEAEAARLASASGRAGLETRVRQMQANRRVLMSLGEEVAPRQLADRVVAALERDALLGLSRGASEPTTPIQIADHLDVSSAGPGRWSRAVPALALAAGLALLVVGGAYWSTLLFGGANKHGTGASPVGPLANAETETRAITPEAPAVAMTKSAPAAPAPEVRPDEHEAVRTTATLASADNVSPVPAPSIDPATAATLAREGRLVIRVASGQPQRLTQMEAMGNGRGLRTWRVYKDVPAKVATAVLAAVSAEPGSPALVGPVMASDHPAAIASLLAPMVGPRAAFNISPPRVTRHGAEITGSYLLELPADALSLASVAATIGDTLKGEVRLEALPESISPDLATEADGMLWWNQPPAQWTPRAAVPLVIEEKI